MRTFVRNYMRMKTSPAAYEPRADINVGSRIEILPAYSSETHSRSIWDEVAGCEVTVTAILRDGSLDVTTRTGIEANVPRTRIKL